MRVYIVRKHAWEGSPSSIYVETADGRKIARLRSRSAPVVFATNEDPLSLRVYSAFSPGTEIVISEPEPVALVRLVFPPVEGGFASFAQARRIRSREEPGILATVEMFESDEAALEALERSEPRRDLTSWKSRLYYVGLTVLALVIGVAMNNLGIVVFALLGVVVGLAKWFYTSRPRKPKQVVEVELDEVGFEPEATDELRGYDTTFAAFVDAGFANADAPSRVELFADLNIEHRCRYLIDFLQGRGVDVAPTPEGLLAIDDWLQSEAGPRLASNDSPVLSREWAAFAVDLGILCGEVSAAAEPTRLWRLFSVGSGYPASPALTNIPGTLVDDPCIRFPREADLALVELARGGTARAQVQPVARLLNEIHRRREQHSSAAEFSTDRDEHRLGVEAAREQYARRKATSDHKTVPQSLPSTTSIE